jgi:hypothetical protein
MPDWLPPLLAGSGAVIVLWVALGVQRLRAYRRHWGRRVERELRSWDGLVADDRDAR